MAVQAQHPPSNALLLNRNGSTKNNMLGLNNNYTTFVPPQSQTQTRPSPSPSPSPGAAFLLDPTHLLSPNNNGAGVQHHNQNNDDNHNNPRKRGRDLMAVTTTVTAATTTTTTTAADNNNNNHHPFSSFNFSLQNHPQLIELSQLHHPHPPNVSTGLKLSFGELQQNHPSASSSSSLSFPVLASLFSDDIATQFKKNSDDLNHFIHAQGEQLRRTLAEKRQRHCRALLSAAEEAVARRLREKEAELEKASRRHAELEARAAQLGAESQVWQAKARAQEAQAASLQAQLQQAMMIDRDRDRYRDREEEEKGGGDLEDAESAYIDPDRVVEQLQFQQQQQQRVLNMATPGCCRACRVRTATVVILPCRHLCVCVDCDGVVQACPVCLGLRNSSVEVYLTT